ncbi:MAG: hypothetical protein EOP11_02900 [Proteobacteria bacterium]|nr:MAG: hypothetical protein EOP11_02900 [Pseudomonadota bacterium]
MRFSARLQASDSPYALGEVRYNVDGSVDDIAWSRPQHDGPALRALAMMDYLKLNDLDPESANLARQVLKIDLDHLSYAYEAKGYDLWEYSFGHHFFTRLVQMRALERGIAEAPRFMRKEWRIAAASLRSELAKHWDAKGGFYHFSLGKVTNWEGNEVPEVGAGRDASAVLAANYARFEEGSFSLNDPKLLSSAWVLEEYFRHAYPFNKDHAFAPGIGRHPDDDYYGGNAWYVLTSGYAELYYGLAARLQSDEAGLIVSSESEAFIESALGRAVRIGERLRPEDSLKFLAKGDGFMATMMDTLGKDATMAEQFSKEDGSGLSAADLTWSYSSFLSSALAREAVAASGVDYASLSFDCGAK